MLIVGKNCRVVGMGWKQFSGLYVWPVALVVLVGCTGIEGFGSPGEPSIDGVARRPILSSFLLDLGTEPQPIAAPPIPETIAEAESHPVSRDSPVFRTQVPTHLMIQGAGFFLLRDPNTREVFVTRFGNFHLDDQRCLVSENGLRLQGKSHVNANFPSDLAIQLEADLSESEWHRPLFITETGEIRVTSDSGDWASIGQILLIRIPFPERLVHRRGNAYQGFASDAMPSDLLVPGSGGTGYLLAGALDTTHLHPDIRTLTGNLDLFSQGYLTRTGCELDLAIAGEGFFVVRDTIRDKSMFTRRGDFRMDEKGSIVTHCGALLQGINDMSTGKTGDLRIAEAGTPQGVEMSSFRISCDGVIEVTLSDGSIQIAGQILLQHFLNPQALRKIDTNYFEDQAGAGGYPTPRAPGSWYMADLMVGTLEELPQVPSVPVHGFRLAVTGTIGQRMRVESTSDYKSWTVVDFVTITLPGVVEVTDSESPWNSQRFYRVSRVDEKPD